MLILALETATDLASCALLYNDDVFSQDCPRTNDPNGQHSATLLPAVQQLLAAHGLTIQDLDAVAFDAGPGAFTGLRMGCALAQGLAVAHQKPVLPVGSLEAMAWSAHQLTGLGRIMPLLDARMGEVYSACFQVGLEGVVSLDHVRVGPPSETPLSPDTACFCGNGLLAYPEFSTRIAPTQRVLPEVLPHATAIAALGRLAWLRGESIEAAQAMPRYVRDKVAKTIAERLAEGGKA